MSGDGLALAEAAERLAGAPFRLFGRDPAVGLDCLGLVGAALAAIGRPVRLPSAYRLRQTHIGPLLSLAGAAGFAEANGPDAPGDVLLVRPGAAQRHIVIAATGGRFVHAHAGLGRVVLTPGPAPWPVEARWRLIQRQV